MKKRLVLKELKKIERKYGMITPQQVVDVAKVLNNPLHNYFDWNDTEAAKKWRIWQARYLLTTIKVELLGQETDAYWNAKVMIDDVSVQGYFSSERVLNDDQLYLKVLEEGLREIRYWKEKYKQIKELHELINEDKLESLTK